MNHLLGNTNNFLNKIVLYKFLFTFYEFYEANQLKLETRHFNLTKKKSIHNQNHIKYLLVMRLIRWLYLLHLKKSDTKDIFAPFQSKHLRRFTWAAHLNYSSTSAPAHKADLSFAATIHSFAHRTPNCAVNHNKINLFITIIRNIFSIKCAVFSGNRTHTFKYFIDSSYIYSLSPDWGWYQHNSSLQSYFFLNAWCILVRQTHIKWERVSRMYQFDSPTYARSDYGTYMIHFISNV